jgi:hypothetical protein
MRSLMRTGMLYFEHNVIVSLAILRNYSLIEMVSA